jgi:hypothetical protein
VSDGYQLRLSQPALERLEGLPFSLQEAVEHALDRLAESPTSVSVRGAFPHRLDRQLYHFSATDFLGKRWHFAAHFRYAQDEQTLDVIAFTVREPS